MKLDTAQIENYENMTVEEKLAALEAIDIPDQNAEIERLRSAITKSNADAAEWKKKHNALLTADEQAKQEQEDIFKEMQEELATLRREKSVSDAKSKLLSIGYSEKLCSAAAEALCDGRIDDIIQSFSEFIKSHDAEMKAAAFSKTPQPNSVVSDLYMTKTDFLKMTPQDKLNFAREHPQEYEMIYKGES